MNGPEHYREAERFIAVIRHLPELDPSKMSAADIEFIAAGAASIAAQAQVHATLALAAATAASQATAYDGDEQSDRSRGWARAA